MGSPIELVPGRASSSRHRLPPVPASRPGCRGQSANESTGRLAAQGCREVLQPGVRGLCGKLVT